MPEVLEGRRNAEFLLSEANGARSRDNIKFLAGSGSIKSGTVLGKITASGKYTPHAPAAADGSETAIAVAFNNVTVPVDADLVDVGITRDAEVKTVCLTFNAATDTDAEKAAVLASLAAVGIIGR
ncbi:MAG: hypothetical protein H6R00_180 [Proteobacteria bacterium]|nr:hypothetical protein [Pseudomonadota bacterium]